MHHMMHNRRKELAMSQQCKWCYSPATMKAWTIRHAWHMLCEKHYEEARSAMKAWMIEKQYEGGKK